MFERKQSDRIAYWTIPAFERSDLVLHGFSTKNGKTGEGSWNMGLHVGDDPRNVIENRRCFANTVGINEEYIVAMNQVHGTHVAKVGQKDRGKGLYDLKSALADTDGLMTNERDVALFACFADCVPLFFLDPLHHAIALSHAGWKGTVGNIAAETLRKMKEAYGTKPCEVLVGIGPSIGSCHYEVDETVAQFVRKYIWWEQVLHDTGNGKYRLDLWQMNRRLLLDCGVDDRNITISTLCTYCREEFFSYRREQGKCGRMAGILMLK